MLRAAAIGAVLAALSAPAAARAATPAVPLELPPAAGARAAAATPAQWLVGGRPGAATAAVARRFGAERVTGGAYALPSSRARAFAAALRERGLLVFAEPDRPVAFTQAAVADDPLSKDARWRDFVVDPALAPPAVTGTSPLLAIIDSKLDVGHPEFAGGNLGTDAGETLGNEHGTATAAVAAAPKNDRGILGIWPGMRAINVPLPSARISCADSARQIIRSIALQAAVINMSYGSADACFTEYVALQRATKAGLTLVAAAGNEFDAGNAMQFPASLPHVLTIAAVTPRSEAAFFSNANAAVDLSAPGIGILTAVPLGLDTADGTQDGYAAVSGTSFASPMVAAAAAWVRAVRPQLSVDQVAQVVRLSARDVGKTGWDPSTGFGVLDVKSALTKPAPAQDPREPNEDIVWVDGRAFGRPAQALRRGTAVTALLDAYEDPRDVYRLRVPARTRLRVKVTPRFGNPDVGIFDRRATAVSQGRHLLDVSERNGTRSDTVSVYNRGARATTAYVVVVIDDSGGKLDAGYTLRATR